MGGVEWIRVRTQLGWNGGYPTVPRSGGEIEQITAHASVGSETKSGWRKWAGLSKMVSLLSETCSGEKRVFFVIIHGSVLTVSNVQKAFPSKLFKAPIRTYTVPYSMYKLLIDCRSYFNLLNQRSSEKISDYPLFSQFFYDIIETFLDDNIRSLIYNWEARFQFCFTKKAYYSSSWTFRLKK